MSVFRGKVMADVVKGDRTETVEIPGEGLVEGGSDSPNRSDYKGSATTDDGIEVEVHIILDGDGHIFSRDVYTEHPSAVIKGVKNTIKPSSKS